MAVIYSPLSLVFNKKRPGFTRVSYFRVNFCDSLSSAAISPDKEGRRIHFEWCLLPAPTPAHFFFRNKMSVCCPCNLFATVCRNHKMKSLQHFVALALSKPSSRDHLTRNRRINHLNTLSLFLWQTNIFTFIYY